MKNNGTRKSTRTLIEALEPRIAPAAVFTLTDVDGDLVTIKTSKGSNADLTAAVATSMVAGSVGGGVAITTINLAANAVFDGTDLSVTAKAGPLGGDALVNVASIAAAGLDLGTVKIGGDLQDLDAGKNTVTSKIKTIDVRSTSGAAIWQINGNVGTFKVAGDLRGAEIDMLVAGATLGSLQIGGSLIGGGAFDTGFVNVSNGTIGKVAIKGSIVGGAGKRSGAIAAQDILAVSIGGSIFGGGGEDSGKISATGKLGPIVIKGDVRGGAGMESGRVLGSGSIASLTIGGSLIGGDAQLSGNVASGGAVGPVKIGRDVLGGSGSGAGTIGGDDGIASFTLGGSLIGGSGNISALVSSQNADIGPVKIGGSILGGTGTDSAEIVSKGNLGNVTIGGDVIATAAKTGQIRAGKVIGAVKIGGSLVGNATESAVISTESLTGGQLAIKSITIGGRVERANILSRGEDTQIGPVKIGGDWIASNLTTGINPGADMVFGTFDDVMISTGGNNPVLFSKIASITIGGQVLGTAAAMDHFGFVSQEIGALKIHGVKVPLTPDRGTDTDVNNTRFILGTTRDVTVHEVA